ncbi:replication protein P [Vibrio vulnificus]|uniref:replication protein P n=1 Tax=Vibrio vulnificus TaxID=672 RepID=UPI000CA0F5D3|nr:replication protein P [Vibrio vulnificus]AUL97467.1 Replication protein P [Vibrio vulnificus]
MKPIANLVSNFNPAQAQPAKTFQGSTSSIQPQTEQSNQGASNSVPPSAVALVNGLFAELQVIFPAWRLAFPTQAALDNAKRTWTLALFEHGIHHGAQIKAGLRKARASGSPHMPSVGQFMTWCRPSAEDLGLPSVEQAFSMIGLMRYQDTRQSVPDAVQAAFNQIQHWDLTHLTEKELFPIFKSHYQKLIEKVSRGEDISSLCPKALPTAKTTTKTQGEKELERLNGLSVIQRLKQQHFKRGVNGE